MFNAIYLQKLNPATISPFIKNDVSSFLMVKPYDKIVRCKYVVCVSLSVVVTMPALQL